MRKVVFPAFAEPPFFGFRGVVARAGREYHVTVTAEMDMYPKYVPWVFVEPRLAATNENGKLSIDLPLDREASGSEDVIGAVIMYIENHLALRIVEKLGGFLQHWQDIERVGTSVSSLS